jgi:hypothetical protein
MIGTAIQAVVVAGRWRPGIGDPTVLGWITVAAYLVAAAACARAAGREPLPDGRPRARPALFWRVFAGLMVALGINKQLDLQSWVTQVGRDVIETWGLYEQRHALQAGFILAVALICAGALGAFLWAARRTLHRRWPALVGMLFILGFVVIRAASFHNVDTFLGARLGGLKWNGILELGGIATVGFSAFRINSGQPPRPPQPEGAMTYRYRVNSDPR